MKITIFGTGYVGLVTGACLADVGHQVICVDVDAAKIEGLTKGVVPIFEPGLESVVVRNVEDGRLSFTTDASAAIAFGTLIFIAVGTPPDEDGSADLKHVLDGGGDHRRPYRRTTRSWWTSPRCRSAPRARSRGRIAQRAGRTRSRVSTSTSCPIRSFSRKARDRGFHARPDRIVIGTGIRQGPAADARTLRALQSQPRHA